MRVNYKGKLILFHQLKYYFLESKYNEADLARSLLFAISNDIGQIACLYAMMHNLKKVLAIK